MRKREKSVCSRLIAVCAEILGVEEDDIREATPLTPAYGFEPIEVARVVILAEKRFRITIHDEDVCQMKKIGDMAAYIEHRLAEG